MTRTRVPKPAFGWSSAYGDQVDRYVLKHFGGVQGVTDRFPYTKADFKTRTAADVFDPSVVLKTNNEYHGLERFARQYHVVGMYDSSAEHWLIAAAWRRDVMASNGSTDARHREALEFALRNYKYNRALHRWQEGARRRHPSPQQFGLDDKMMDQKDEQAEAEIRAKYVSDGGTPPPRL